MTGEGEERIRTRTLIIALVAAVATVSVFVVALRLSPPGRDVSHAVATEAAAPPPTGVPDDASPESARATPLRTASGQRGIRFEPWVSDVARWLDIPQRAMRAYALATVRLAEEQPGCHLSWVTLAGLGSTASDHGRVGGRRVTDDGTVSTPIGSLAVRDSAGTVVSSPGAAGPLQLAPAVWERWKATASDGTPDIQDIDDAALTAGRALCADGRNLAIGEQWLAGVSALHPAPLIQHRVQATATVYGTVGQSGTEPNKAALTAVEFAIDKIGLPYEWGGNGLEKGDVGFDCSGLTTAAYAHAGIPLMRTAHTQFHSVPHVPDGENLRLGDLVFYGNPSTKIHHVGIYIGNHQMIDAPTFGQAVQVHNYRKPGDHYAGAGRPAK